MQPSVRRRSGGRGTEEDDQNGEEENEEGGLCICYRCPCTKGREDEASWRRDEKTVRKGETVTQCDGQAGLRSGQTGALLGKRLNDELGLDLGCCKIACQIKSQFSRP